MHSPKSCGPWVIACTGPAQTTPVTGLTRAGSSDGRRGRPRTSAYHQGGPVFFHHRDLAYTVRVDNPNPVFARMLQQAIGGPEGELRVMTQYMFQGFGYRGPKKYRDMLLATATEEIGHAEALATD